MRTLDVIWINLLDEVLHDGDLVPGARNGGMVEKLNVSFELPNIDYAILLNKRRNLCPKYMCAEVLWYFMNTKDASWLKQFAPSYDQYLEEDGTAYWAYGPRFVDQLHCVLELLRKYPESRRAVISLWHNMDLIHSVHETAKDVPCVCQFQFFIRDNKLILRVDQRSQDLWVGFPNDIFAFTCIQRAVAGSLGLECGSYFHNMGSCHIYSKHFTRVREALAAGRNRMYGYTDWEDKTTIAEIKRAASAIQDGLRCLDGGSMIQDLVSTVSNWNIHSPGLQILRRRHASN